MASVAILPSQARAYRPFDGTDADIAKTGEFELELGPAHFYRDAGSNFLIAPATVLNLGLARRLELVADFKNFISLDEPQDRSHRLRLRDTDLLAKILLRPGSLQGDSGPSVAVEAGVLLPEPGAHDGFGGQADVIVSLANEVAAAHLNESFADNRAHRFEVFSSIILEGWRTFRLHPVAEIFLDRAVNGGSEYSALLGALWAQSDALAFDLGARAARIDGAPAWELRLGLTWNLPLWERHGN